LSKFISIQWLKRLRPAWFRQDLIALFDLLHQQKIKPLIAQRFPLAEARQAHEVLGKGGVTGKIVLVGATGSRVNQERRNSGRQCTALCAAADAEHYPLRRKNILLL
jgi:hypothetical protein